MPFKHMETALLNPDLVALVASLFFAVVIFIGG